jgi:biotin carboxyl carrier protein
VLVAALTLAACASGDRPIVAADAATQTTSITSTTTTTSTTTSTTTTTLPTTTTVAPTTLPLATSPPAPSTTSTLPPGAVRVVTEQAWEPYATVGGITLRHPSSRVERIGFHQSNNDGARPQEPLPTAVAPVVLEDRERDTDPHGAADVVVDPAVEIRAPVTGTVVRGGSYILYCDYRDHYLVFEPDDHPGWEVKVLHIGGVEVGVGDHVVAGETVIAPGPTQLPFASQVDDHRTGDPAWPHVHIEVVDPTIPDRPTPGGCG